MTITTMGIDVGSSAVKAVVMRSPRDSGRARPGSEIVAKHTERLRRRDQKQVIDLAVSAACEVAGLAVGDIEYVATTGEGELVDFRTGHFYGMTAHARGAIWLVPEVCAVLDVGALHARAMKVDERSKVLTYRMTSQCASGSGQFLENISRYLGVTLDEIGPLSTTADKPERVSSICAVLAETDVINMVSRGIALPNILKGIHVSMAGRFSKLLRKLKLGGGVALVSGGLARDEGLLLCMREALDTMNLASIEVTTHPDSIYAGAIGAALWGAYRSERLAADGFAA
jgi:benzoyl-CoA reductase subunit D